MVHISLFPSHTIDIVDTLSIISMVIKHTYHMIGIHAYSLDYTSKSDTGIVKMSCSLSDTIPAYYIVSM